jgi:hypothetical protein
MSALGLGVDFMQIISIFTSFGFKWPIELVGVFTAASSASMNDQLLAPECSVQGWSLQRKWLVVQLLPGCFILMLVLLIAANWCAKLLSRLLQGKRKTSTCGLLKLGRVIDTYLGICITAVYTLYFSVVKGAMSIFNCVENRNGVRVLVAYPSVECGLVGDSDVEKCLQCIHLSCCGDDGDCMLCARATRNVENRLVEHKCSFVRMPSPRSSCTRWVFRWCSER